MYKLMDVKAFRSSTLTLGCTSTADWPSNIMETWIWNDKLVPLKVLREEGRNALPQCLEGPLLASIPLFTYTFSLS